MRRNRAHSTPPILLGVLLCTVSCAQLNYPASETEANAAGEASDRPSPPVLLEVGFGVPEEDIAAIDGVDPSGNEVGRSWSELMKEAREARAQGKFDEVRSRLEQAATQLENRPPENAQRRAVFGMRARLARDLAVLGRVEESDELADTLFREAKESPALGGVALADLATLVANRRAEAAASEGRVESQLPLLEIAFDAAANASPSRVRMNRSFDLSQEALDEGDPTLARRAIDRAVLDAQTVAPTNKDQLASLKIYKARIALAQGDLLTAEASAISANRLFEEIGAPAPNRAVAEATMARVVAEAGDEGRARAIIAGARARIDADPPLPTFAVRVVLGAQARIERALGQTEQAKVAYREALALPAIDFAGDTKLTGELSRELEALESPEP